MKASIKFRDEQPPLLRAKIPLNIMNYPFQSGITAGESKELSLNLSTFFDSGPSLRFSYRPNNPLKPLSFILKTGIGHFGSPTKSPLTMSAEFNLIGNQNPSFFINFKPDFGDFSLKKSLSSAFVKNLGEKLKGDGGGFMNGENFINNAYFKGNGFLPATMESKAAAGQMINGLLKGTEVSAKTSLPLRDFAMVNFRWGLRVPPHDATIEEVDTVLVGIRDDRTAGIRLPLLVMNKVGIEHVSKANSKVERVGAGGERDDVAGVCLEVKKQLGVIQAENGLLSNALNDLRSDMAAGKIDPFSDHRLSKFSGGGGIDWRRDVDKKSLGTKVYGGKTIIGEGNEGAKCT